MLLSIFLQSIKNLQKIEAAIKNKYEIKSQLNLNSIVNSLKKKTIKGTNSGPFILPSDNNFRGHYG